MAGVWKQGWGFREWKFGVSKEKYKGFAVEVATWLLTT